MMTEDEFNDPFATLEALRNAVFAEYAKGVRHRQEHPNPHDEHTRRRFLVEEINIYFGGHDLMEFSADHLEVLVMLLAYWRELEEAEDAEINAPAPEGRGAAHPH